MKKIDKKSIPCLLITAVLLLADIIFVWLIAETSLLTITIVLVGIAVLVVLTAAVFWLTLDFKRKIRFTTGCILSVAVIVTEIFGIYYIRSGAATINKVTSPTVEYAEIGVYVRKDDPAKVIADVKDYNFGILKALDRNATDLCIENLNKELNVTLKTAEYTGIAELLDGLLDGKTDAILLNVSFLEILAETKGHEEDLDKIRELYSVTIENSISSGQPTVELKETFTMYISGIDCNGSVSRRSRSDVNILATVNIKTGQVLLVSTPRDYYVPLSVSDGIPDKLTHAGIYGIEVSRDTVGMLYDTKIDYYFRLNFEGFAGIIDALGGIEVYSEYDFLGCGYPFEKGYNTVNGLEALGFARERKNVEGGDRGRGKNQMEVIRAVISKATSPALLKNYRTVLDSIEGSFETSVPYEVIASLVKNQLREGTKWNVVSYSVNGTGATRKPYSLSTNAYVMLPDETTVNRAKELIEQVKNGEVPTP